MISQQSILRLSSDVRYRAVDDETVVIRQEAAEALVLNDVAGRILELIDGARQVGAIVATLADEYDIDSATLAADVEAYLKELLDIGVVLGASQQAAAGVDQD